jgi:hypothetical protein
VHIRALQEAQLARSVSGRWAHGSFPGKRGRRPALALVLEEAEKRLRRVGRQRCGHRRRDRRRCRLQLRRWCILSPLANACSDCLFNSCLRTWGGALRGCFQSVRCFERLDTRDDLVHCTDGCIGHLLGSARQGHLQLVTKPRQLVEILSMRKACAQVCFVVAQLALGYSQVSHDLLLLRLSAADDALDGVEDLAGAVKVTRELGVPGKRSCHVGIRCSLRVQHETKGQATGDA